MLLGKTYKYTCFAKELTRFPYKSKSIETPSVIVFTKICITVKLFICFVAFVAAIAATGAADVNVCSGVADNIFLPFIGNCSKYILCMSNTPLIRTCDAGYLFDARSQSCNYPDKVQCVQNCTSALSSFCYDRTCTKYVLCYANTPVIRECCDGLQYNAQTDRCDFPEYVDCVENMCTIFNDPTNITFLSSRAACDKYYVCMDGEANAQNCSSGLQFNPACNCCDFPSKVNCSVNLIFVFF